MRHWIFYLIGFIIIIGIKYYYSKASCEELVWILSPTAWWVRFLSGIPFKWESHIGYINHELKFIIAPACSGVQFMTITFATLLYSFVHRMATMKKGFYWIVLSLGLSYLLTIFVNGIRIVISIHLLSKNIGGGWMTPERIHTIEGTAVYFVSLLIIRRLVDCVSRKIAGIPGTGLCHIRSGWTGKPAAISIRRSIPPMLWYFSITLGIPLLNGAFSNNPQKFIEYAIIIFAICLAVVFIICAASALRERSDR